MKLRVILISFFVLIFSLGVRSQPAERRISRSEYIDKYKEDAIREMNLSGVPASITLAQGILESADGNSPLAVYANNHFGIKCHSGWKGETMHIDDDKKNECFRKYNSVYESFKDHSDFLKTRSRYSTLFDLKITDYKGWANGLKKAGYATNPKYPQLLIDIIEQNNLQQFDKHTKSPTKSITRQKTSTRLAETQVKDKVEQFNNINYIFVKKGDTFYSISKKFEMNLWQIYKYNDLNENDVLKEGDKIYLQPKRCKAKEDFYVVTSGDTMRNISQKFGIKLKSLYKKNKMILGTQPSVGQKLSLRKKIK